MGRIKEIIKTVFAGIKEVLNNEDGYISLDNEEEKLLDRAYEISNKRIADLERNYSGEISKKPSKKGKNIVPTVKTAPKVNSESVAKDGVEVGERE